MGTNIAILIGCSKYTVLKDLDFVLNDIKLMHSTFVSYCNCKENNVISITNENNNGRTLSYGNINEKLTELITGREGQVYDNLYFYYSGHGVYSNGLYLVSEDGDLEYSFGMIGLENYFFKKLQGFKANNYFLFLDTCRSVTEKTVGPLNIKDPPSNMVIFYSCSVGQESYSLDNNNISAYTFCLNSVFSDANVPCDVKGFNYALEEKIKENESDFWDQKPVTYKNINLKLEDVFIKYNGSDLTKISRNTCAFWINTCTDDNVPWIDERYKVALIDYLLIIDKGSIIILIQPYGHKLLNILNYNMELISSTMSWSDDMSLNYNGGHICFLEGNNLNIQNAFDAVNRWRNNWEKYQLIISVPSDNPEVLKTAKEIANHISITTSVDYQVLTLEDSYTLSQHHYSLENMRNSLIDEERIYCSPLFNCIHQDLRLLSQIYSSWIKEDDLRKYRALEIASNSFVALNIIFSKMEFGIISQLLSDKRSRRYCINWDNIVFYIYCFTEDGNFGWQELFDKIYTQCSDGLRDFLKNDKNNLRDGNIWSIYYHMMKEERCGIIEKGTPEYYRFLLGTEFNEDLRLKECIGSEEMIIRFRDVINQRDSNSIYLLPDFMR